MTTSKLPEWPEDLKPGSIGGHDEFVWLDDTLTAALARMEALVLECGELLEHADDRISGADRRRIDELLAACARKEAGR